MNSESRCGPVLFCGDPHGRFRHIVQAAQEADASAVILLGDLQARRPLNEELAPIADMVWFIHGNHDTDSDADFVHLWDSSLADRSLDGRVVQLPDGTRVAGLGGVFRGTVWVPPEQPLFESAAALAQATPPGNRHRAGPPRRHWSTIYPDTVDRLAALEADVLVTHEAPSCHPYGYALIDDLARAMRVKTVFHGHHHDRLNYTASRARLCFQTYGVGLRGITDQSGEVRRLGELDFARQDRLSFCRDIED